MNGKICRIGNVAEKPWRAFDCAACYQSAGRPGRCEEKENREAAEEAYGRRQAGKFARNPANPRAHRHQREHEHGENRKKRRSRQSENNGEKIDNQHERPDKNRKLAELKNRHQHQQQRESWKRMAPPRDLDFAQML